MYRLWGALAGLGIAAHNVDDLRCRRATQTLTELGKKAMSRMAEPAKQALVKFQDESTHARRDYDRFYEEEQKVETPFISVAMNASLRARSRAEKLSEGRIAANAASFVTSARALLHVDAAELRAGLREFCWLSPWSRKKLLRRIIADPDALLGLLAIACCDPRRHHATRVPALPQELLQLPHQLYRNCWNNWSGCRHGCLLFLQQCLII